MQAPAAPFFLGSVLLIRQESATSTVHVQGIVCGIQCKLLMRVFGTLGYVCWGRGYIVCESGACVAETRHPRMTCSQWEDSTGVTRAPCRAAPPTVFAVS